MNAENAEKCRAGNTVPPGKKRKISIENAENAENAEVEGGGQAESCLPKPNRMLSTGYSHGPTILKTGKISSTTESLL